MNQTTEKALVILDDEVSYLDLLAQLLATTLPCPIHTFTRPLTALSHLPRMQPGLVVTDYHMPEIDGLEFVRRLGQSHPGVPVIMITGHALELEGTDRSKLPALRAILPKPFNWQTLSAEITSHWPELRTPRRTGRAGTPSL